MTLPGDDDWPIHPRWFVIVTVLAVLALAASHDWRLGVAIGAPAALAMMMWLYIAIRFRPRPGGSGVETVQQRLKASTQRPQQRARIKRRSGAKSGPDAV